MWRSLLVSLAAVVLFVGGALYKGSRLIKEIQDERKAWEPYAPVVRIPADVGGTPDRTSLPAVGYLRLLHDGPIGRLTCGQTLVASRVAATAGHCIGGTGARYVAGYGAPPAKSVPAEKPLSGEIAVRVIALAPDFQDDDPLLGRALKDDLALLFLEKEPEGIVPLPVERASRSASGVSIGYAKAMARTERRRIEVRVDQVEAGEAGLIKGEGIDGGTCYGDSGSPLVQDGALVGVVSWSDKEPDRAPCTYVTGERLERCRAQRCKRTGTIAFVEVAAYQAWIDEEIARQGERPRPRRLLEIRPRATARLPFELRPGVAPPAEEFRL